MTVWMHGYKSNRSYRWRICSITLEIREVKSKVHQQELLWRHPLKPLQTTTIRSDVILWIIWWIVFRQRFFIIPLSSMQWKPKFLTKMQDRSSTQLYSGYRFQNRILYSIEALWEIWRHYSSWHLTQYMTSWCHDTLSWHLLTLYSGSETPP